MAAGGRPALTVGLECRLVAAAGVALGDISFRGGKSEGGRAGVRDATNEGPKA